MSTVDKALGLLDYLSVTSPEIGLSEFQKLTKMDKGTVYRYLTSLKNCGFLEQNPVSKAYRLGPAIIRLSMIRETTVPLIKTVSVLVDKVAQETQELVHASLPQSKGMTALYQRDGGISGTRVGLDESEILPFHATSSGLVYLAFAEKSFTNRVLKSAKKKYTNQTAVDEEKIRELIAKAKSNGYAVADELYESDVSSVAFPFFGNGISPTGAIAVAMPVSRMTEKKRKAIAGLLARASQELSHDLAGNVPEELKKLWARI